MHDARPGLRPDRLATLIRRSVDTMSLDLRGATVLTEAATRAYAVTPVIAAVGGAARVVAVTRATRFGSVDDVIRETMVLADLLDVEGRIEICDGMPADELAGAEPRWQAPSGVARHLSAVVAAGTGVPTKRDLWLQCTCPDDTGTGSDACKHAVAALFALSAPLRCQRR